MHTEKQAKETPSRLLRQSESGSPQMFRLKDNRESSMIQGRQERNIQRQQNKITQLMKGWGDVGNFLDSTSVSFSVGIQPVNSPFFSSNYSFGKDFNANHSSWANTGYMVQNTLTRGTYTLAVRGELKIYNFKVALHDGTGYKEAYGHSFEITHIQGDLTFDQVQSMKKKRDAIL